MSVNGTVNAIVVQPDGKILVGGSFTNIGGSNRNHLARLNADGTLDTFNPNVNNTVHAMTLQSDGKIIIGGAFTIIGNSGTHNRIARLNTN